MQVGKNWLLGVICEDYLDPADYHLLLNLSVMLRFFLRLVFTELGLKFCYKIALLVHFWCWPSMKLMVNVYLI